MRRSKKLIQCVILFTFVVKWQSLLWTEKALTRMLVNAYLGYELFVTSFGETAQRSWFFLLFTSWVVCKFFVWASTDPSTNLFNRSIVWPFVIHDGSQTTNWIILIAVNCNVDMSFTVRRLLRTKLLDSKRRVQCRVPTPKEFWNYNTHPPFCFPLTRKRKAGVYKFLRFY